MTIKEKFITLLENDVKGNWELLRIASTLPPSDQLKYLTKIEESIKKTKELIEHAKK